MNEEDGDPVTPTDAGAQFGGRNKKAKKWNTCSTLISVVLKFIKSTVNYLCTAIKPSNISKLNTGPRRICKTKNRNKTKNKEISHSTVEMDSHADTDVCGSNFVVLNYTS